MSKETQMILDIAPNLPITDLLEIQQIILDQLKLRTSKNITPSQDTHLVAPQKPLILGAYSPSSEEIEAELAEIFTPEELVAIKAFDVSTLPIPGPGEKTIAQIISEDREDRF